MQKTNDILIQTKWNPPENMIGTNDNRYILGDYFIPEIEYLIFQNLDLIKDYRNLMLVNKYYKCLFANDLIINEYKLFLKNKKKK